MKYTMNISAMKSQKQLVLAGETLFKTELVT